MRIKNNLMRRSLRSFLYCWCVIT